MINFDKIYNLKALNDIYQDANNHIRLFARDNKISVKDAKHYRNYAINRYTYISLAVKNKDVEAQIYYDICEKIYTYLSDSAKWPREV